MKKQYNNFKKKVDTRESISLKSQFKSVQTGIKNGVFIFSAPLSIEDFSKRIDKSSGEIIKYFFLKGKMLNLNAILSEEQIGEFCLEHNYDFEKKVEVNEINVLQNLKIHDEEKELKPRPAIVTIMGHVDHGKTTLLDYIRKSKVVVNEAGGITQHIGAYQITHNKNKITFIDTPGHEAFTQMRARGANLTDIVILVVAADDGIMPQTEEAIDHAKAAKVPIIVFINKIDKPNVNFDKVISQLSEKGLVPEEWGGNNVFIKGSALKGTNVNELLDVIILTSQIADYKANPNRLAIGICLESNIDKGRGPVATVLIKNGTLVKGDYFLVGDSSGKVRNMYDENNMEVLKAEPSKPIKVTGLDVVPEPGQTFVALANEKEAKEIAKKIHDYAIRKQIIATFEQNNEISLNPELKKLEIILKADVHGSLEAIKHLLSQIEIEGAKLNIIRSAIGNINESDVQLAKASRAIVLCFNVRPTRIIKDTAEEEKVKIFFFDIIYKLKEGVEKILLGILDPIIEEKVTGEAVVKQLWKHSDIGTIAGCLIESGEILRNTSVRVIRDGAVIYKTKISSLRKGKENINKAQVNTECGITLANFNDFKEGDILEGFEITERILGE